MVPLRLAGAGGANPGLGLNMPTNLFNQSHTKNFGEGLDISILLVISSKMGMKIQKLGELLADARKRRKFTLRAVQETLGISNAYLSQLETGKVQSPSPVVLHKLSELYEVPYATVMEIAGYPVPQNVDAGDAVDRFAARIGNTTPEEEDAIVEYLRFIRSRKNPKGHG
jgi:HTH-type transcriptional regulator, competence development regulator